jgi:hypothetical protein
MIMRMLYCSVGVGGGAPLGWTADVGNIPVEGIAPVAADAGVTGATWLNEFTKL